MKFAKLLMLLGFMVVVSQQERFPYFSGHEKIIQTPWAYANGYPRSESLYSFLLAREFAERMRPAVAPSFSDWVLTLLFPRVRNTFTLKNFYVTDGSQPYYY